jgi:hypothetical protein
VKSNTAKSEQDYVTKSLLEQYAEWKSRFMALGKFRKRRLTMSSKHFRKWTLALALVVIGAGVALASVTFDPMTGKGFVGKGDM